MKNRHHRKRVLKIAIYFCGVVIMYAVLLYHPKPVFPFVVNEHNLTLRVDLPFSQEDGRAILRMAHKKLCKSPFFNQDTRYQICICQTGWRRRLFFFFYPKAGGVCYPGSHAVFLSGADLIKNRLVAPSGKLVMDERTLDYFMAHELTHAMVDRNIGLLSSQALPAWIREGYADYIGRGGVFFRPGAHQAYVTDTVEMTTPAVAPYIRFNFIVSYLLDQLQWEHSRLHCNPIPQSVIELQIRQFFIDSSDIDSASNAPTRDPRSTSAS